MEVGGMDGGFPLPCWLHVGAIKSTHVGSESMLSVRPGQLDPKKNMIHVGQLVHSCRTGHNQRVESRPPRQRNPEVLGKKTVVAEQDPTANERRLRTSWASEEAHDL